MAAHDSALSLDRRFGYWAGLSAVVASMVGSGILATSGYQLRDLGNPWVVLMLWTIGGLLALAGALTVSELAAALPRVGGDYVFIRDAFGRLPAFLYGWGTLLVGFSAPTALNAKLAISYATAPFADATVSLAEQLSLSRDNLETCGATVLVLLFTASHCLGQRESGAVQVFTTAAKILLLLLIALAGLLLGTGSWSHFSMGTPWAEQKPAELASSLRWVIYAYIGWTGAIYLAGEIREPSRLLPRCVVGGTLAVITLYLLVNVVYIFALPPESLVGLSNNEVQSVAELAARALFGQRVAALLSLVLAVGVLATVSVFILTGPRVMFAMARDGLFPAFAGHLDPKRRVPIRATLTQGVVTVALLWSGKFEALMDFTTVGLTAMSMLVTGSIFVLRPRLAPDRGYRMPLYPLPPLAFLSIMLYILLSNLWHSPVMSLQSLGSILLGVPLYYLLLPAGRRGRAFGRADVDDSHG